ncbi:MAG: glycoside hydrolase family 97 C-terminal domain-containing protein [Alistipes sp.]|nr:glycoside hydrolase family 97 C-terminal domain-containing protein [Alistipes sp.]
MPVQFWWLRIFQKVRWEVLSAGRIGEYIVTARRAGEKWYVGGLTDWTPRTLEADLSFLVPGREYTATLLCDDERSDIEPERHTIASQKVTSATRLQIPVAPGGGFALKIEPVETDE